MESGEERREERLSRLREVRRGGGSGQSVIFRYIKRPKSQFNYQKQDRRAGREREAGGWKGIEEERNRGMNRVIE